MRYLPDVQNRKNTSCKSSENDKVQCRHANIHYHAKLLVEHFCQKQAPLSVDVTFPLSGLTRYLRPLDNAHAEHTRKKGDQHC